MREIKFRLIKDGKIVGYEKHVLRVGVIHIFHSVLNDDVKGYEWNNITHAGFIVHNRKERYTGLKDKNGNEIYEGDKLSMSYGIPPIYDTPVVEFIGSGFYVMTSNHNPKRILLSEFINIFGEETEITGNIHEELS